MSPQKQIDPASDGLHSAEMGQGNAVPLRRLTPHGHRGEA